MNIRDLIRIDSFDGKNSFESYYENVFLPVKELLGQDVTRKQILFVLISKIPMKDMEDIREIFTFPDNADGNHESYSSYVDSICEFMKNRYPKVVKSISERVKDVHEFRMNFSSKAEFKASCEELYNKLRLAEMTSYVEFKNILIRKCYRFGDYLEVVNGNGNTDREKITTYISIAVKAWAVSRMSSSQGRKSHNKPKGKTGGVGRSKESTSKSSKDIQCFGCAFKGHTLKDCRLKGVECNRCHRKGHLAKKCDDWRKLSLRVKKERHNRIEEDEASSFEEEVENLGNIKEDDSNYVKGLLNGFEISVLADTGAQSNFISEDMCKELGLKILNAKKVLRVKTPLINQSFELKRVVHVEVEIKEFGKRIKTRCYVLNNSFKYLILGSKTLKNIGFDLRSNQVEDDSEHLCTVEDVEEVDHNLWEEFKPLINADFKYEDTSESIKPFKLKVREDESMGRIRPYSVPYKFRPAVEEQINEWLERGLIEPSDTKYAFPLVVVPKKNNSLRVCVDFKPLNKISEVKQYPLPLIEDCLRSLRKGSYYSTIDLKSGYNQIRLHKDTRKYCGLIASSGVYQFRVLPFGLSGAVAHFQAVMTKLLQEGILKGFIIVYLDDILVISESKEQHLEHLKWLFNKLLENKLFVNKEKTTLFARKVNYLGWTVADGMISIEESKKLKFDELKKPTNRKTLESFLGFINYFRNFVPNLAKLEFNLNELRKAKRWKWEERHESDFIKIVKALKEVKMLYIAKDQGKFIVETDASLKGLGAVLKQVQDGEERIIAYTSRKLADAETRYHINELELLAVVHALKKFYKYLIGVEFEVRTDSRNVTFLKPSKLGNNRITRWLLFLSQFSFNIYHLDGTKNALADYLSRNELVARIEEENWEDKDYLELQRQDEKLMEFINNNPKVVLGKCYKLIDTNDSLKQKVLVPEVLRKSCIELAHSSVGHQSYKKTLNEIKKDAFWPTIAKDVAKWIEQCDECQKEQSKRSFNKSKLGSVDKGMSVFSTVAIDVMGPLPETERGNIYMIGIVDLVSRWVELIPTKNHNAETVVDCLIDRIFLRFGYPDRILSDNAEEFKSVLLKKLCKVMQIEKIFSAVYNPQMNGLIERMNRIVKSMLRKRDAGKDWDVHLNIVQNAMNRSVNSTTKLSPYAIVFGRPFPGPRDSKTLELMDVELLLANEEDIARENWVDTMSRVRENLFEASANEEKQAYMKSLTYNRRVEVDNFTKGSMVLVYSESLGDTGSSKLDKIWSGPFVISERDKYNAKLETLDGISLDKKVNLNRLKTYKANEDLSVSDLILKEKLPSSVALEIKRKRLIGRKIKTFWSEGYYGANGGWHKGLVVDFDRKKRQHLVLYKDIDSKEPFYETLLGKSKAKYKLL